MSLIPHHRPHCSPLLPTPSQQVSGSLNDLLIFKDLEQLILPGPWITGALSDLVAQCTKLERLDLSYSQVTGTLADLSHMTLLDYIDLSECPGVDGNITDLGASLTKLDFFNFNALFTASDAEVDLFHEQHPMCNL